MLKFNNPIGVDMMKKLLITLTILLFAAPAMASPYLVADPVTNVDGYNLLVNGVEVVVLAEQVGAEVRLHYDLVDIPVGPNEISVSAYNLWGESDPVPFDFVRPADVISPAGIKLEK